MVISASTGVALTTNHGNRWVPVQQHVICLKLGEKGKANLFVFILKEAAPQ